MTKEKFAYAFDYASMWVFGALICALLSLLPLQYIDGADDRRLLCCWFFFILFACGALELFFGVIITFRRGLKYYDATIVVNDRAEALALGQTNKQIAIFDLANLEEIRL